MSDLFTKKAVPVQACQYKGPKGEYPQWFHDALTEGHISPLGLQSATIYTDRGPSPVHVGDWVLRAEDGRLWPTDDAYFAANYEAAPATSPVGGLPVSGAREPLSPATANSYLNLKA